MFTRSSFVALSEYPGRVPGLSSVGDRLSSPCTKIEGKSLPVERSGRCPSLSILSYLAQ